MPRKLLLLLFIILCLYPSLALMRPGYFPMHDDMQAMRVHQMATCFRDWQLPCRWVPDMGYGYGYPQFNYYPPLPYYLMTAIHFLGLSIITSVKIGFILSFVVAGIGMFLLSRRLWGTRGALVSTLFYLYLPYRAVNVYDRGAMGEIWAMAFFPWVVWGMERIWSSLRLRDCIFLSLAICGLMTSHSLSTMMIAPFLILWWVVRSYQEKSKFRTYFPRFVFSGLVGFGLSSYYVLPSLIEKSAAHLETMTMGYFNYLAHYASLRQIFTNTHWGYGSSLLGPYDDMSLTVGIWHWVVAILAWILLAYRFNKTKQFLWLSAITISALFYLFLVHQKSTPIWNAIPLLEWLQFPWRFLAPASFLFSLAAGALLFSRQQTSKAICLILLVPLIYFNLNYMRPNTWFPMTDQQKFSEPLWQKQQTISIFDYLPEDAHLPPATRAPDEPWFIDGSGEVTLFQQGSNWQSGEVLTTSGGNLRLPLFNFPGWQVKVNNQIVPINSQNELGLITFEIPQGQSTFHAQLKDTPIRIVGNTLTLVSIIISLSIFSFPNVFKKYEKN